jgi:alpha-L-fucosidase
MRHSRPSQTLDIVGDPRLGEPFEANWESLKVGYQAPDWYRDAKFGLWAHWGAQCVPEAGDWYARHMYIQGHPQYAHHLATYGHPADVGFMEIINQWRAENWDPDDLMSLYKRAGAKYFVAMANHHDNLDNWESSWHDWNSVRVGPRRDIVGTWARTAREHGLRFGVSNHATRTWHWFQTAYGYDPEGARAGERYDAYRLGRRDGRGKWWEGLDPQELYGGAIMPLPHGVESIRDAAEWYNYDTGDQRWTEVPPLANPMFVRNWYRRCKELVDKYEPDLLYFDNFDLPLGQAGLDIAAHFYNASVARRGSLDVVLNTKELPADRQGALVEDVERGYRAEIVPHVWQTDTCIGDWHYNRQVFERKGYMKADAVIHRLCDVVAKNGNLLLSIPMRGDGTIDSEERAIVTAIGDWMERFGDAIHGTRPWHIFGEGPTEVVSGMFGESAAKPFTSADLRFTTRSGDLFATTLGAPGDVVTIASLGDAGQFADGRIDRVEVVDNPASLNFKRDAAGLHIEVPGRATHAFGVAFRIIGSGLVSYN